MPDINVNKLSEALNTKADIDLNNTGVFSTSGGRGVNLTSSTPADAIGKEVTSADFFQSTLLNYTTNRILEIPQDIKLELNNGTLTLKAGSKVYVPNGFESDGTTPKFDVVVVESDKTISDTTTNVSARMLFLDKNSGSFRYMSLSSTSSGITQPSGNWIAWYDTNENLIKHTNSTGEWQSSYFSLPLGIIFSTETVIAGSIDQVFNGFGYIGSTLFLLPGVKTVVPDGRNENGTCKNKAPSTVASVKTETISRAVSAYMFTNHASSVIAIHHYVCSKTKPTVTTTTLWYNPETNLPSQVLSDGTVMTPYWEIPIAKFTSDSTGKITSFEPYSVDSVANSNASNFSQAGRSYLSGLGMPSNRYIDLTLGASGSTYTAPANGWVILSGNITNQQHVSLARMSLGQWVDITDRKVGIVSSAARNVACIPVRKGDSFVALYGSADTLRFIYAEGYQ